MDGSVLTFHTSLLSLCSLLAPQVAGCRAVSVDGIGVCAQSWPMDGCQSCESVCHLSVMRYETTDKGLLRCDD